VSDIFRSVTGKQRSSTTEACLNDVRWPVNRSMIFSSKVVQH